MKKFIKAGLALMAGFATGAVFLADEAAANIPLAGTVIENRAEAVYLNQRTGIVEQVFSNTVAAIVQELPAIVVEPDQTIFVSPGIVDQYVFFVENIGNVDLNPVLAIAQQLGDDYDVQNITVFLDLNGNGVIDSNEGEFPLGAPFPLDVGERVSFVVQFQVPGGGVGEGDESLLDFTAIDAAEGVQDTAVGTAIVAEGGLLVFKQASEIEVEPGDTITYTVSLRNNGTTDIEPYNDLEGQDLTIDGNDTIEGVIFRDDIPQYTTFESMGNTVTFTPLYHLFSAPDKHTYVTTPPADPTEVEAVAFIYNPDNNLLTPDAYPGSGVNFSTDVQFTVRVNSNTGGLRVVNRAETYQPLRGDVVPRPSNIVETPIVGPGGVLRWVASDLVTDVERINTGADGSAEAFLNLNAGACNADPTVAESVQVSVRTSPENDFELVTVFETAPNSGIFNSVAVPILNQIPAVQLNTVLTGFERTIATASVVCGLETLTDTIIINDGGYVFNSLNNEPVPNATVTLFDAAGNVVQVVTTNENGFYQFFDVAPGTYTIQVVDPGGLVFPSQRLVFPGFDRNVDPDASYGNPFNLGTFFAAWGIDIPLDPNANLALTLVKTGDKDTAQVGDFVEYRIEVTNNTDFAIINLEINDILPPGFAYVEGTARLDGVAVPDPNGLPGPNLNFDFGGGVDIDRNATVVLTYVVRVLPTVGEGDRTNEAVATGFLPTGIPVESNVGRHTVTIDNSGGVFASESVVVGKVWLDVNGNGIQDSYTFSDVMENDEALAAALNAYTDDGTPRTVFCKDPSKNFRCEVTPDQASVFANATQIEPGIPGVRIYTQDGRFAITDEHGKYSLPGLAPKTHVFVVEQATLPIGTEVQWHRTRDAMGPGSRFVDVKRSELRAEDFPIGPGTSGVLRDLEDRIENFQGIDGTDSLFGSDLPLESGSARRTGTSNRSELGGETRVVNRNGRDELLSEALPPMPDAVDLERTVDLEGLVKDLSPELGFMDLSDGDTVTDDRISIRVKGPAAVGLALEINGERVSSGRVGQRAVWSAGDVQAAEFVAVELSGGANEIKLIQTDPFGNDRGHISITVYAPGKPTGLDVIVPSQGVADPSTPLPVVVRVTDDEGRMTGTPLEVTLESSRGSFDVTDIRDTEQGVQVFIDNGEAVFDWIPPTISGSHTITVRSTLGDYQATVKLTPDLSTRMAAGVIEGAVRFGEGGDSLAPLVEDDELSSFEDTIEGVNGELYLKGRIRGDALLTLRYTSDRDSEDRLFRDVNPDDYYPVYGDNSERGFDAQSNSELYIKVEKGLSYVLYGDINIAPQADAFQLGGYSRSLTGGHAHLENDRVRVDLFAAYTDQTQVIREFPARGISGPYDVDLSGYIDNSETVEIITYDREQPEVELRSLTLARYKDYSLDFFGDAILFRRPVPSVDDDLNPQTIRITFEVETDDADEYWVYGGEVSVDVTEDLTVGYREIRSEGDARFDDDRMVRAGYVELDTEKYGKATLEVAQTENGLGDRGEAWRAEYEIRTKHGRLKLEAAETDEEFDAPQSSVAEGRREFSMEAEVYVTDDIDVELEALYTEDKITDEVRWGGEARVDARINDHFDLIVGSRYVNTERPGQEDDEVISAIAGITWRPASQPGSSLTLEYEQDFVDTDRRRFLIDASHQYNDNIRAYTINEITTSEGGEFGLGDTDDLDVTSRTGVEISWNENLDTKTEFREGNDGGLANEADLTWTWREWHKFYASLEHVQPLNDIHRRNTSVSLGYNYENEEKTRLFDSQLEWSLDDEDNSSWYGSVEYGHRWQDWTLLFENRFAYTDSDSGERFRDRARVGYAYRPVENNKWVSLGWYGFEYDEDNGADSLELTHTWALGAEYNLRPDLRVRGRHAGRYNQADFGDISVDSTTLLLTAGAEWDVHERIVLGGNASIFWDDIGSVNWGVGGEIGFVPAENTMVSVGYNWAGIEEDKIRDIHRTGFFLRVRAKIDEGIWDVFDRVGVSGQ